MKRGEELWREICAAILPPRLPVRPPLLTGAEVVEVFPLTPTHGGWQTGFPRANFGCGAQKGNARSNSVTLSVTCQAVDRERLFRQGNAETQVTHISLHARAHARMRTDRLCVTYVTPLLILNSLYISISKRVTQGVTLGLGTVTLLILLAFLGRRSAGSIKYRVLIGREAAL